MRFRFWKKGMTQRVYINDLECLLINDNKAYIKPLPKKQRTGENEEIGVELVVTDPAIRPTIERALEEYGLMPDGVIETGCFEIYKNIATKHRFTGGARVTGSVTAAQGKTYLPEDNATRAEKVRDSLTELAQQLHPRVSPRGIEGMANATSVVEWAQHFAAYRDNGGRLEDTMTSGASPLRLGIIPAIDHVDLEQPNFAQTMEPKDATAGRRRLLDAVHNLPFLEHCQLMAWPDTPQVEAEGLITPPASLSELRSLLYCLCAHHQVVPGDDTMDFMALFNVGQITNYPPGLEPTGLAFSPRKSFRRDTADIKPRLRVADVTIPPEALRIALTKDMAMQSPFDPTMLHLAPVS